ncbi:hypothetical protein CC80DRAFT_500347 [Byssothecium circinans]|uniref:Uncharacterized protein n=1 Tax=Byssothecium circinans TaxID=147558 RepID=A0A6A5UAS9_9PLEO|nr:hypothetical protein CC80DRAFT_500347 [Byssothecium circinans]
MPNTDLLVFSHASKNNTRAGCKVAREAVIITSMHDTIYRHVNARYDPTSWPRTESSSIDEKDLQTLYYLTGIKKGLQGPTRGLMDMRAFPFTQLRKYTWARYGTIFAGYTQKPILPRKPSNYLMSILEDLAHLEEPDLVFGRLVEIIDGPECNMAPTFMGNNGEGSIDLSPVSTKKDQYTLGYIAVYFLMH